MSAPTVEYVLNAVPGEPDVIHTRHGDERCNRDQMTGRLNIDADTAAALLSKGDARACEHCNPETPA